MEFKKIKFLSKQNEYDDVYTFFFDKKDVAYEAGQYAHLLIEGETREVRELSFASAPSEDNLMLTMHVGSNTEFKNKMSKLSEGDEVSLFKIKGKLEFPQVNEKSYVFLSGGVGITPFRSILKENKEKDLRIDLVQVQRGDFLFKNELESLVNNYYSISPENFDDEITNIIEKNRSSLFYICGSKRFVDGISNLMEKNMIDKDRIQIESFTKEKKN
ncbi:MAG: FAD-dependent oxidoreductase [Fusobacteriaceae bacterium]|jgi:ferredoxin-NADP reductase|nr:FAD-dependent oxidoreductase [Fusobacteriaceae bacterium]MBP6467565.1 FAD-dependent oxidoreductase [Fusobacteriaceae bacterium]MBP9597101.1 FAD-dependent oxidoreductase [Fusobacteriaceae bacterium]MBU9918206.1 FAD-dependent oxidoreductase [Fusobacteriaceae bacterium]